MKNIPVLRPRLPQADQLLPYLRRIDANRTYTNWGPLTFELEGRLAKSLGLSPDQITTASSGTAAMAGAIFAHAGRATPQRPLALVPAYTFVATATAAEECGYRCHLADVGSQSWMLDPVALLDHPDLGRVGLVVVVAPFGKPVPQPPWQEFQRRTGIPVVIDGAACFDRMIAQPAGFVGDIPVALSFHATKSFAAGEGGGVVSTDDALVQRAVQCLNFGFYRTRECKVPNINGKMSEYHAAVGLAEFDALAEKQADLQAVIDAYRALAARAGVADRLITAPDISRTYVLFRCADAGESQRVQAQLTRDNIDFRLWYGAGLHRHAYFAAIARDDLSVTDRLAPCLLGLPLAPDLPEEDIGRVVTALAAGLQGS